MARIDFARLWGERTAIYVFARMYRALLTAALAAAALPHGASASATIRVETTDDVDFPCSLRNAVRTANTDIPTAYCALGSPGIDTVVLGPGVHTLTVDGAGENQGLTGDLDVTDDLIIRGAGPTKTIIDA